jgi:hypothetical protein
VELSPQALDVERPVEKFAFNYVPEDVEIFFREALVCYSHNQYQAFASMCRRTAAVTFADLGNSTKLRLFDSISDVREMATSTRTPSPWSCASSSRASASRCWTCRHQHLPGGGVARGDEGFPVPGLRAQGTPAAGDEGAEVLRRGRTARMRMEEGR